MATLIPCEVDTTPMAAEIGRVSHTVSGTTAAVVTMQTAVIAAEKKSAEKVCSNVNRGFFTLMRSQISQKIASKKSRVEALLMQLAHQKRQLLGIKSNMEREYGQIAARYLRIFTSINKELEQKIRQIDQPVFELVNKQMLTSSNRMNALTGWVSTSQLEGIKQSQQILVSNMKSNAQTALEQSSDFLSQISEQRVLTGQVLISNPEGNEDKSYQIPVIIFETQNDSSGYFKTDISLPASMKEPSLTQIVNNIRESSCLSWKAYHVEPRVSEEFSRLLEASSASQRVKSVIRKIYSSSSYETL